MATTAEREFHRERILGSNRLTPEIGSNPTRLNRTAAGGDHRETARRRIVGYDFDAEEFLATKTAPSLSWRRVAAAE